MNYAAAVSVVQRYLHEQLPIPVSTYSEEASKTRAYSRWTAEEIISRIMEEELKLPYHISGIEQRIPIEIVNEFIDELYTMWELSKVEEHKYMFSVSLHTAEEILSLFYF